MQTTSGWNDRRYFARTTNHSSTISFQDGLTTILPHILYRSCRTPSEMDLEADDRRSHKIDVQLLVLQVLGTIPLFAMSCRKVWPPSSPTILISSTWKFCQRRIQAFLVLHVWFVVSKLSTILPTDASPFQVAFPLIPLSFCFLCRVHDRFNSRD